MDEPDFEMETQIGIYADLSETAKNYIVRYKIDMSPLYEEYDKDMADGLSEFFVLQLGSTYDSENMVQSYATCYHNSISVSEVTSFWHYTIENGEKVGGCTYLITQDVRCKSCGVLLKTNYVGFGILSCNNGGHG